MLNGSNVQRQTSRHEVILVDLHHQGLHPHHAVQGIAGRVAGVPQVGEPRDVSSSNKNRGEGKKNSRNCLTYFRKVVERYCFVRCWIVFSFISEASCFLKECSEEDWCVLF